MERLKFLDGLRGIAALMVTALHCAFYSVAHHTYGLMSEASVDFLRLGVQVFFVVSGFALRYSIGDARITWGYAGRFALRRSLRIDPPYWVSIAVVIGLHAFVANYVGERYEWTTDQVVAHITYTQGFLGVEPLSGVFWSLCIEVQFYILLLVLLWVAQRARLPFGLVTLPLLVFSLATIFPANEAGHGPKWLDVGVSLLPNYALFYLGTAAAEAYSGGSRMWLRIGLVASAIGLAFNPTPSMVVGIVTALAIDNFVASRALSGRVIQFFGKISYSLYLIHSEVAWLTYLVLKTIAPSLNQFAVFTACFCAATFAAWLMYHVVERPTHRLAKMVHLSSTPITSKQGVRVDRAIARMAQ